MNNQNWVEVLIKTDPAILEELSPKFFALGCQGINEVENGFKLYFFEAAYKKEIKEQLISILKEKQLLSALTDEQDIANENWNENWKESFKKFYLGKNIVVQPDWENHKQEKDETVITIAPKMAFGTGHHETTQLILQLLELFPATDKTLLDAGTGSAILAIYAALTGAYKVTAFDNDPEAIENAHENCHLNEVQNIVELQCSVLNEIKQEEYDFIIANINRNVLLQLAPKFLTYAHKKTVLILSGLLLTDRVTILETYQKAGWQAEKEMVQGEWMALLLKQLPGNV